MLPPSIRHTLLTAAAVAFAAGTACAQGNNPPAPAALDTAKALGDINNAIKALGEKLDAALTRINSDLKELRDDVSAVKRDVGDVKTRAATNELDLRRLNEELVALKKRLDEMKTLPNRETSKVTQTARVRFANKYGADMSVYLNGRTFTVLANEEREEAVAPGPIVYQILGYQTTAKYNTLTENQLLTVTLRPAY